MHVVIIAHVRNNISFSFWLPEYNFGKILSQIHQKATDDPGRNMSMETLFPDALIQISTIKVIDFNKIPL